MKIPFGPIYYDLVKVLGQYFRHCGDIQKKKEEVVKDIEITIPFTWKWRGINGKKPTEDLLSGQRGYITGK